MCDPERPRRRRRGAALLEAIAALAIFTVAIVAAVALAANASAAVSRARARDREVARASALLDAVALWPRADLDRHLGDRPQGPWRMRVDRVAPTVYDVVLADSAAGAELLRTSLFRAEAPDATR